MKKLPERICQVVLFCLCCAWLTSSVAQTTQMSQTQMPKIEGDSFAGRKVVLPDDAKGKVAVLVLGFTKASKGPTSDWAKKLTADFAGQAEIFQLPVLEDVPRLIRVMVISSIKKGVPENQREHFVPILQREAELKKFVNYKEPDDAYLIVLDRGSSVVRQQHGGTNDASYPGLRSQIEDLLSASK
jgi:hypothetical protein